MYVSLFLKETFEVNGLKYDIIIIFGISHSLSIDESHGYVLGNSSVFKIYIIRPKPGPVAKLQGLRIEGWESNPRHLDY